MIRTVIRGYCYCIIFFFAIASLKQCVSEAHADESGPEWYSAFGKHCVHIPIVKCDVTLEADDCDRVQETIALINNDVGTQLLQFGGMIDMTKPGALQHVEANDVIFVTQATVAQQAEQCASPPGCVHAMTQWNRKAPSACLEGAHIRLDAQPGELSDGVRFHVTVHEMLHALGLNHNPFPIHNSMINQYAPRALKARQRHLHELDKTRLCMVYDCIPNYYFDGR